MDALTHGLLGATVARVAAPRSAHLSRREQWSLGAISAMFPDIDFAAFPVDPLRFLADWHQGPTHSVVLLPLWALLMAGIFCAVARRPRAFVPAAILAGLGIASHIAADAITAYGTAILYPLSPLRVGLGTTYVVDPLFTCIVAAGLIPGLRRGRRWVAGAGLALLGAYVAGQALLQERALELARASGRGVGASFERIAALAQPFSPFNWKLIGVDGDLYHEAYVNLAGHATWLPLPRRLAESAAAYRAPAQLAWRARHRYGPHPELRPLVERRWMAPDFAAYRRFAAYPAVSWIDRSPGICIWFTDLRYDLPALPDTFRYGYCREAEARPWRLYRLRYFSEGTRQPLRPAD